jgi:hypothetical protein
MSPDTLVRRRGTGMTVIDNGSIQGELMLVGGIADSYSCGKSYWHPMQSRWKAQRPSPVASSTYTYPAADVLTLPLNTSSVISSRNLPSTLTGSELAVADFAMTTDTSGNVYLAGGQDSSGDLVPLTRIGKWTKGGGWVSRPTTGDVPMGRIGATLVAHPTMDLL